MIHMFRWRKTHKKTSSNHYYLYIIMVFRHQNKFRCPVCKNIVGNLQELSVKELTNSDNRIKNRKAYIFSFYKKKQKSGSIISLLKVLYLIIKEIIFIHVFVKSLPCQRPSGSVNSLKICIAEI